MEIPIQTQGNCDFSLLSVKRREVSRIIVERLEIVKVNCFGLLELQNLEKRACLWRDRSLSSEGVRRSSWASRIAEVPLRNTSKPKIQKF